MTRFQLTNYQQKVEIATDDLDLISSMQDWCQEHFANDWALGYPEAGLSLWYFVREEDATMFILRWS